MLLAPPIHNKVIDNDSVADCMKPYCLDLIEAKKAIEKNKQAADPFKQLVDLPEVEVEVDGEKEREIDAEGVGGGEWYIEEIDEGVDHYMFPRSMGYLVLENQYKR